MGQHLSIVTDFVSRISACTALRDSNAFVPLASRAVGRQFERMLAALVGNDMAEAQCQIDALNDLGLRFQLVRYPDPHYDASITGFLEYARPGEPQYRGWGGVLVRAMGGRGRVYQAPHVRSDVYTLSIATRAFVDDPQAAALVVAGSHRYANGEEPPIADVTRSPASLFHVVTACLARTAQCAAMPLWFIQFHGSQDRLMQPMITASNGSEEPWLTVDDPLVRIKRRVEEHDGLTMGVCGWHTTSDEPYFLCGKENIQGLLLEGMGLRSTFMHFELERRLRHDMFHRVEPGYGHGLAFLAATRDVLDAIEPDDRPPTIDD